jgi:hypothetical protein
MHWGRLPLAKSFDRLHLYYLDLSRYPSRRERLESEEKKKEGGEKEKEEAGKEADMADRTASRGFLDLPPGNEASLVHVFCRMLMSS